MRKRKQGFRIAMLMAAGIAALMSGSVHADDFSYGTELEKIVAARGYCNMQPGHNFVTAYDANSKACWDQRAGVIGADQADLNNDGTSELLVYYAAPSDKQTSFLDANVPPTALYVDVYTNDGANAILKDTMMLGSDGNVNFQSIMVGIMDLGGRKFLHTEEFFNAYIATGNSTNYMWYGFDGNTLRPVRSVGKTDGGSSEIAYGIKKYTDEENYEKKIVWADDGYLMYNPDVTPMVDYETVPVGDAIRIGFSAISLPDAGTVTQPPAEYGMYPADESLKCSFPSYWNTNSFRQCFWYCCYGEGSYTERNMTVTLYDATGFNPDPGEEPSSLWGTNDSTETVHVDMPAAGSNASAEIRPEGGAEASTQPKFGTGTALPDGQTAEQPAGGSEYLFEDADRRYLTQADVSGLSAQAACYAKNEIYARRGRRFNSPELQQYFNSKSWYNGTIDPASFTGSQFNDYELKNIEILKNREFSLAPSGYQLDQPGYDINAVGTISLKGGQSAAGGDDVAVG